MRLPVWAVWDAVAPRRRSVVLLIVVVLLGLSATLLAASALRRGDENRAAQALNEHSAVVSLTVAAEVRRYGNVIRDVAAAVGAQADLQAAEFAAITAPIDGSRLPGATGVSLVVPAPAGQVSAVQQYWRARGATGLTLRPAEPATGEHAFTVMSRPVDDSAGLPGRDLAVSQAVTETLRAARDTGSVAASRPYQLLRDAGLPAAQQQLSTILVAPVTSKSPRASDRGRFRGWVILGLRGGDFLRDSIAVVARDIVTVTLSDTSSEGTPTVLARWNPGQARQGGAKAGGSRVTAVPAAQRAWQLTVTATGKLQPDARLHPVATAWIIGIVLTALLAILTATVTTSRDRAVRRVAQATRELREDIARRELVEDQLRQREEELVGFAGIVAHDLRQPLARISAYTDFLREEVAPSLHAEHREFLERVRGGATRMQSLLDDLLDYATADNRDLKITSVDLAHLVAEVVTDRTAESADIVPAVSMDDLPTIDGDPTLLRQVFDNLIGNALKYTHPGTAAQVNITAKRHDDAWTVEISDRGIGIPAAQRKAVFTAFTRANGSQSYPGTGLGLTIVHRIIERHHGKIVADENPGGGTVFRITLPEVQPRPGPATGHGIAHHDVIAPLHTSGKQAADQFQHS
ncbi:ATP-binding protein [Actinoplanes sp. NPDC051859]|uniref:sensor histidine kinase n=1 Tax=Actinoplanes sp. NPDC051859 TaxID=3363909 RepID=UPI0037B09BDE